MQEKEKKSELCKFVGANLREIRAKMNLSQETVANETSLSVSHYRGIEQGRGNPSIQTLERISDTAPYQFAGNLDKRDAQRTRLFFSSGFCAFGGRHTLFQKSLTADHRFACL